MIRAPSRGCGTELSAAAGAAARTPSGGRSAAASTSRTARAQARAKDASSLLGFGLPGTRVLLVNFYQMLRYVYPILGWGLFCIGAWQIVLDRLDDVLADMGGKGRRKPLRLSAYLYVVLGMFFLFLTCPGLPRGAGGAQHLQVQGRGRGALPLGAHADAGAGAGQSRGQLRPVEPPPGPAQRRRGRLRPRAPHRLPHGDGGLFIHRSKTHR